MAAVGIPAKVARLRGFLALVLAQASASIAAEQASLADLIEKVEPAVVRIDITRGNEGTGSGFVVDTDGVVVTNHHVIAGAEEARVVFKTGETAAIVGTLFLDPQRDIAVLKIDRSGAGAAPVSSLIALPLAPAHPRKGESVVAIGAPRGLSFSASEGIVSAVREGSELNADGETRPGMWIQTTAPISPGNSGGPLVDRQGRVVGANTMILMSGQNLNFAISSVDIADAIKSSQKKKVVALADGAAKAKRSSIKHSTEIYPDAIADKKIEDFIQSGQSARGTKVAEIRRSLRDTRDDFKKMKAGTVGPAGIEAKAQGKDYAVVHVRGQEAYYFPDLSTKDRLVRQVQTYVDKGDEMLRKMDDPKRGLLTYLAQYGPELVPNSVGEIGSVHSLTVMRIVSGDEFLTVVGRKPVAVRGIKTGDLATGSKLDGRAMFVAGTLSFTGEDGGPEKVFVVREFPEDLLAQRLISKGAMAKDETAASAKSETAAKNSAPNSNASKITATKVDPPAVGAPAKNDAAKTSAAAKNDAQFRTWTDQSGKFKVDAQLVANVDGQVVLKRRDNGKVVTIPIATLSKADQDHLKSLAGAAK